MSTPVPTGGRGWGTDGSVTLQVWEAKMEPPLVLDPTMPSLLRGPAAAHILMGGKLTCTLWAWAPATQHCGIWGLRPAEAAET